MKRGFGILLTIASQHLLFLSAGCYSIDSESQEQVNVRIDFIPSGARIVSHYGPNSSIISDNTVVGLKRIVTSDEFQAIIFPTGHSRRTKTITLPPGLYARWPSGAETRLPEAIDYGYTTHLDAYHPDSRSSRRRMYDELASFSNCTQTVFIRCLPPNGLISIDGSNYVRGSIHCDISFTYNDFAATSKTISVNARWPSGTCTTSAVIPIAADSKSLPYSAGYASVLLAHPFSNSLQYAYDSLPQQYVGVSFDSHPSGAIIYAGTNILGQCPAILGSVISFDDYKRRYLTWRLTAAWNSGAYTTTTINVDLHNMSPSDYIFMRPIHAYGIDNDIAAAKERLWQVHHTKTKPIKLVHITSDPEGATLYEGDIKQGQCPDTLQWIFSKDNYLEGVLHTKPIVARWPSGATAEKVFTIRYEDPDIIQYTFMRPTSAPHIDTDVNYAIQIKRLEADRIANDKELQSRELAIEQGYARESYEHQQRLHESWIQMKRLEIETTAANQLQAQEQQMLINQQRLLAETERANRASEDAARNAQLLQSMQLFNQTIQNNIRQNEIYEIRPSHHDYRPYDGYMDAGSYYNPYVIERK